MTIRRYRLIDLAVLAAIAVVLDVIGGLFGFFALPFYVAISVPVLLICAIRWGKAALVPTVVVACAHFFLHLHDGALPALVNAASFIALMIALPLLAKLRFIRPRTPFSTVAGLYVASYLSMATAEALLRLAVAGPQAFLPTYVVHAFNFVFCFALMAIAARQKDLLVPMAAYLAEVATVKKGTGDAADANHETS